VALAALKKNISQNQIQYVRELPYPTTKKYKYIYCISGSYRALTFRACSVNFASSEKNFKKSVKQGNHLIKKPKVENLVTLFPKAVHNKANKTRLSTILHDTGEGKILIFK
jgi:hypothetical protein